MCHKIGDFGRYFARRGRRDFKTAGRVTNSSFVIGGSRQLQTADGAHQQHAIDEAGFDDDVGPASRTRDAGFGKAGDGMMRRIAVRADGVHASNPGKSGGS